MNKHLKVALIQMQSTTRRDVNRARAQMFLQRAIKSHPDIICLPEIFLYFGPRIREHAICVDHPMIRQFQDFAKRHRVCIILGSIILRHPDNTLTNSSLVLNEQGRVHFRYDKKYLYSVKRKDIQANEARFFRSGRQFGVFRWKGITCGLGICVDLRYPEYFRELVKRGVQIIFLPSNFRTKTGAIAWDILTIARAVENQTVFCACNQTGGSGAQQRCGQTRIVSFDGKILKGLAREEGLAIADIAFDKQTEFRRKFPVLKQM